MHSRTDIAIAGIIWHSMYDNCVAEYTNPSEPPLYRRAVFLLGTDRGEAEALRTSAKKYAEANPFQRLFMDDSIEKNIRKMITYENVWLRWDFRNKRSYIQSQGSSS